MTERTLEDWLGWIETLNPRSIDLTLDRVRSMLDNLGLRQPDHPVIIVGGTNGKGSTATMCAAILRAAGYKTGLYTSPHLVHYNERINVDGVSARDEEIVDAFVHIEDSRRGIPLTYFEYGTVAALEIFRRRAIDVAVLEVGLGGRLDAVNAVEPDVSVVTSIGVDHTEWLGPDRESIGREKAGIFRAGRPAICGDLAPPESLVRVAREVGATLYLYGRDFHAEPTESGWNYRRGARGRAGLPFPALRGDYQLRNAACALTALDCVSDRFPVTQAHIREGLLDAVVPGRFQLMPGTPPTILDVAHNVQAAEVLAGNLRRHRVHGRTHAVFGMLRDKPIAEVARTMSDQVDVWYVASIANPRGASASEVSAALRQAGIQAPIQEYSDVVAAYRAAVAAGKPNDRLLAFGSFYTVGDILLHLNAGPA